MGIVLANHRRFMGRVPDNFYQSTWSWFVQDTWKARRNLTIDVGLRMYRWGYPLWGGGEASAFSFDRFDPKWGVKPPALYSPVSTGSGRRAKNPLTGEILPANAAMGSDQRSVNHWFSLFKSFPLKSECRIIQFRWELYNAFNHTQFDAVNTSAQFNPAGQQTNTQFGKVTSARNERRMQFSLRFSF
jgi:hypothetical protein